MAKDSTEIGTRPVFWLAAFLILAAGSYLLDGSTWFQAFLLKPYSVFLASLTKGLLTPLGLPVQQAGPTLACGNSQFEYSGSCTGSLVFLLYASAVLPFPEPWRYRLKGLLFGLIGIFFLNLIRGSLIVLVVSRFPATMWSLHIVIGQIIVIAGMVAVFIRWLRQTQGRASLFHQSLKESLFRTVLVFAVAYCIAYLFYFNFFIRSELADWIRGLIVRQAAALVNFFVPAKANGNLLATKNIIIELQPACLRSPVVVILSALVAAWPARWWKKLLLILVGFLPAFYVFNLFRVFLVVLTWPLTPAGKHNFSHTFFGPAILMMLLVGLLGYSVCIQHRIVSPGTYLAFLGIGLFAGIGLGYLADLFYGQLLLPWVLRSLHGHAESSYDPEQIVSRMTMVHVFIWTLLVNLTPDFHAKRKGMAAIFGLMALPFFSAGFVAFCMIFNISPYIRVTKGIMLAFPVLVYALFFWKKWTRIATQMPKVAEP